MNYDAELYAWMIAPGIYSDIWVIQGYILNDGKGRFADRTLVRTSPIVELDMENRIARTMNTTYKLLFNHEVQHHNSFVVLPNSS
jgi:hypothetical protein